MMFRGYGGKGTSERGKVIEGFNITLTGVLQLFGSIETVSEFPIVNVRKNNKENTVNSNNDV